MIKNLCHLQEICQHFITSDNKPKNHDVRSKYPCQRWLAMDCEKMMIVLELEKFTTGKVTSCNIEDVKRKKREIAK